MKNDVKTNLNSKIVNQTITFNAITAKSKPKIQTKKPEKLSEYKAHIFKNPMSKDTRYKHPTPDEMKSLTQKVYKAVKEHKIFTVYGDNETVRKALVDRGWIEKLHESYVPSGCDSFLMKRLLSTTIPDLMSGLKDEKLGHIYKLVILSKMVECEQVYLYWEIRRSSYYKNRKYFYTITNFVGRKRFSCTTKEGLCQCAKQPRWINYIKVPRTYCLSKGNHSAFNYDFKITAAISLLNWFLKKCNDNEIISLNVKGKISEWIFYFALQECNKFIEKLKHQKQVTMTNDVKWNDFINMSHKAIRGKVQFGMGDKEAVQTILQRTQDTFKILRKIYPYIEMDGFMNIWILKPSCGCKGVGIHICRTLDEVARFTENSNYVIQKYIERPLLIHNTKFDIRQWFLISSTMPLTIWMYKESYLRFCSQLYTLTTLHESIHLTNNAVQNKYCNMNSDSCLPHYNMWHLKEFQQYLLDLGHPYVFDDIYRDMKQCIISSILASHDESFRSATGFELYGADFMLTEDFKPWLIEINCKPALFNSTPVTSVLCPAVSEDVIKVIIDYSTDKNADTGDFEMVYKEFIGDV